MRNKRKSHFRTEDKPEAAQEMLSEEKVKRGRFQTLRRNAQEIKRI